jgi:ribA/ribD-fused uncharacterized protein
MTDNKVTSNGFRDEYRFLSNMFASPIHVEYSGHKIVFPAAENAFQAMKISVANLNPQQSLDWVEAIAKVAPLKSKSMGKSININLKLWDQVAFKRMERVQFLKYTQNSDLLEKLKATNDTLLVEYNYWGDTIWGINRKTGEGENRLGKILMNLRQTL